MEAILYEFKIEGLQAELKNLVKLKELIEENKKALEKGADANEEEAEKRKIIIKQQQEDYRNLQKSIEKRNRAEKVEADTLEKMRLRLSDLNKELDKTPINTERFKELTNQSKKLRDEIKGADEATGRFQGNVGNYKGAIMDAFKGMGINVQGFTKAIEGSRVAMSVATTTTGGMTGAVKRFTLALAASGVGLIVIALGALVTWLMSTQAGIDQVNKVLKPLGAVLSRITGLIQKFGAGLADILSGNFVSGFEKLKDTVASVGDEFVAGWKDGKRMAEIIIEIDNAKLKLAQNEGRIARAMEEQREILDNVNLSDKKRKEAGEEFLKLQDELLGYKKKIAALELEDAKLKAAQNDTSREQLIEIAELEEEAAKLEAEALAATREAKNKINAIDKKASDDYLKSVEDKKKKEAELHNEIVAREKERREKEQEKRKKSAQAELEEFNNLLGDMVVKQFEQNIVKLAQYRKFEEDRKAVQELFRQEKLTSEQKELEDLKALYDARLISYEQYEAKRIEIEQKYSDIAKKIKQAEINGKLQSAAAGLGQISEMAGKETTVGKIAAVAQATINTYLAASNAFASAGNPILGAIMAAIAVAGGLIQVAKIVSVKTDVPKYARGVIGLRGGGTSTSDSIPAMLSKDESVMTAKATRAFAPQLAAMEMAVGNKPNYNFGTGKFASGIISMTPKTNYQTDVERVMRQTINEVTRIPVIVAETDITSTQEKVRQIKVEGDL